ncbi:MAG: hypothetical protein M8467_08505 [Anaerolineae bacterium]|nr:hypothetical protein [Anaerolineae bacterium]
MKKRKRSGWQKKAIPDWALGLLVVTRWAMGHPGQGLGPENVRSWYGLPGKIVVENEYWHRVRVGGVAVNHPPLVNLFLRRGLSRKDRLRLSHLHEFGHFQMLPLALALLLCLLRPRGSQQPPAPRWLVWIGGFVAHQAAWEMASEAYVMAHEGVAYRETYRRTPNLFLPLFWVVMGGLAMGLSRWLTRGKG